MIFWFLRMFEVWQPNQVSTDSDYRLHSLQTQQRGMRGTQGLEFTFSSEKLPNAYIYPFPQFVVGGSAH